MTKLFAGVRCKFVWEVCEKEGEIMKPICFWKVSLFRMECLGQLNWTIPMHLYYPSDGFSKTKLGSVFMNC